MIKVGIIADRIEARAARQGWRGCGFGGIGYTGVELLRLLAQHPQVEFKVITSRGEASSFTIGGGGSWLR
jgi:hypothetical protein